MASINAHILVHAFEISFYALPHYFENRFLKLKSSFTVEGK